MIVASAQAIIPVGSTITSIKGVITARVSKKRSSEEASHSKDEAQEAKRPHFDLISHRSWIQGWK